MEARNRTIEEWFTWIHQGLVVLPRFQRFEAWGLGQIEGILENILRKPALPVGALLVLAVGSPPPFHARPIVGAPKPSVPPTCHLLDGQQRLTALWRSLSDNYEDVSFFVAADGGAEPDVQAVRRYRKKDQRHPLWCDIPAEAWARKLLPVRLLRPGDVGAQAFETWMQEAAGGDIATLMAINKVGTDLRHRVASYPLPFLELPLGTDKNVALDVFIKMNTMNTALSAFDIVVAQVEAAIDESLHQKVEGLKALVPDLADFGEPGEIAMQVAAVLAGKAPVRATFLTESFGKELIARWPLVEKGLRRAVDFLAEERIFASDLLPADPLLTLLGAFWASAPDGKDGEGNARRLARRALWTGSFSERYQKTSATRTELDHRQLVAYRDAGGPLPDLLDPVLTPLPEAAALRSAGWPKTRDRLGRAVLAASLRLGGHDFADEAPFSRATLKRREYHHLFPQAFLTERGVPRRAIFTALNCALISWRTNRTISAKPPSVYMAERAGELQLTEAQIDRRLLTHAIPPAALRSDDYEGFLEERAIMIHKAMSQLCAGEPFDFTALKELQPTD
ncbi:GmrSD restriction endonuclease domain-containing protein [Paracoccus niistensis]|uniref:DUF262 domain-containing protein n=1 Tax=Paracoccus niistensis TaxID=632935 RepID=A0ABV6I7C8_9RHOB